jgi:hypothetical protein
MPPAQRYLLMRELPLHCAPRQRTPSADALRQPLLICRGASHGASVSLLIDFTFLLTSFATPHFDFAISSRLAAIFFFFFFFFFHHSFHFRRFRHFR